MRQYEDAAFGSLQLRTALACTGGVFADGFGLGIIGIALSLASTQLGLDAVWQGLIGGGALAGLFAGALVAGSAADRFGRRPIFVSNMVLAAGLSALQYRVGSGAELLLLRIGIGFLLGTDYVVSKALLTELMPRRSRGPLLSALSVAWAAGYASAFAVGVLLAAGGPSAWRNMLLASAIPCLLMVPLRASIPESAPWLVSRGRLAAAARVVARLGRDLAVPALYGPHAAAGALRRLMRPPWRRRALIGCCFFTCQVIPYFAVGTFVPQVMAALSASGTYVGGLIYNGALLLGAVAGVASIGQMPRRRFLLVSFLVPCAALLALAVFAPKGPAMLLLFALFAGVLSAASNLCYVYLPELFATDLRASGIGLAVASSRLGSAISTFLLPWVLQTWGVRMALGACAAVLLIGAAVCAAWAPETRGLGLQQLESAGGPQTPPAHAASAT